jgi:phosphoglycerate dehydrogenase-like enzyme
VDERTRHVVCIAFPPLVDHPDVERLRALGPAVEVIAAPYVEEEARRRSRHREPLDALRATAPALPDAQRQAFARAEAVLAFDLPVDLVRLAPRLRWVQCIGAGVEHFAGAGLDGSGVVVTNSSGIAAVPIAEFVLGRLLAIWKHFPELERLQREHTWQPMYGRMLAGSTIGILGVGAIGSAVAERVRALGCRTLGVRRRARPGEAVPGFDEVYGVDRLREVVARCDALVLAAPASEETFHLIDRGLLGGLKRGAVLVNVARGSLVDEGALIEALHAGDVAAAVLDVFESEPLPAASPLWDEPNVFVSAHCAVSVERYLERTLELFVENVGRWLRGEPLRNVVAPPPAVPAPWRERVD